MPRASFHDSKDRGPPHSATGRDRPFANFFIAPVQFHDLQRTGDCLAKFSLGPNLPSLLQLVQAVYDSAIEGFARLESTRYLRLIHEKAVVVGLT